MSAYDVLGFAPSLRPNKGSLPSERVQQNRPFYNSGVDFAGPLSMVPFRGRGRTSREGYIALFVCLASKATHIEIVTDLTAVAFVAAFKRFVSRRGHCVRLMSDNATNFRGADRELKLMLREASKSCVHAAAQLADLGTNWDFIPHFGGLWEAGVKSTKFHLRRIVGGQILSYEEMTTLTCQIEACLNSRPLYPISNCLSDLTALIPGHLQIGEPLTNILEVALQDKLETHPLSRWQHLSRMRHQFWRRWSQDYLQHLQPRQKWLRQRNNLAIGTLVVLKDPQQPPASWHLGRIVEVHTGSDNFVRVVTVKTVNGLIKRLITKVCPLPLPTEPAPAATAQN